MLLKNQLTKITVNFTHVLLGLHYRYWSLEKGIAAQK